MLCRSVLVARRHRGLWRGAASVCCGANNQQWKSQARKALVHNHEHAFGLRNDALLWRMGGKRWGGGGGGGENEKVHSPSPPPSEGLVHWIGPTEESLESKEANKGESPSQADPHPAPVAPEAPRCRSRGEAEVLFDTIAPHLEMRNLRMLAQRMVKFSEVYVCWERNDDDDDEEEEEEEENKTTKTDTKTKKKKKKTKRKKGTRNVHREVEGMILADRSLSHGRQQQRERRSKRKMMQRLEKINQPQDDHNGSGDGGRHHHHHHLQFLEWHVSWLRPLLVQYLTGNNWTGAPDDNPHHPQSPQPPDQAEFSKQQLLESTGIEADPCFPPNANRWGRQQQSQTSSSSSTTTTTTTTPSHALRDPVDILMDARERAALSMAAYCGQLSLSSQALPRHQVSPIFWTMAEMKRRKRLHRSRRRRAEKKRKKSMKRDTDGNDLVDDDGEEDDNGGNNSNNDNEETRTDTWSSLAYEEFHKKTPDQLRAEAELMAEFLAHRLPISAFDRLMDVFEDYVSYQGNDQSTEPENEQDDPKLEEEKEEEEKEEEKDDNDGNELIGLFDTASLGVTRPGDGGYAIGSISGGGAAKESVTTTTTTTKKKKKKKKKKKRKRMRFLYPNLKKCARFHTALVAREVAQFLYVERTDGAGAAVTTTAAASGTAKSLQKKQGANGFVPDLLVHEDWQAWKEVRGDIVQSFWEAQNEYAVVYSRKMQESKEQSSKKSFQKKKKLGGHVNEQLRIEGEEMMAWAVANMERRQFLLSDFNQTNHAFRNANNEGGDGDNDGTDATTDQNSADESNRFRKERRVHMVFDAILLNEDDFRTNPQPAAFADATADATTEKPSEAKEPSPMEILDPETVVFVDNLPIDIHKEELVELYSRCGPIRFVQLFNQRPHLDPGELSPSRRRELQKLQKFDGGYRQPRFVRKRTPVYGMIGFETPQACAEATCDPLRIFGMVIRRHDVRSVPSNDMTTLYLEQMPFGHFSLDVEHELSRALHPNFYLCLHRGKHTYSQLASCQIRFSSFAMAHVAHCSLYAKLQLLQQEEGGGETAQLHWMRTPPDAMKYWTRHLGFDF